MRDWIRKLIKIKLTFLKLFDNPFSKTLFIKDFLYAMAVFGYLPKLKRVLGLGFGAHFGP